MPKFLDVNVWLPLVWNGHVASHSAHLWASTSNEDLVMCRVTELALLRHLTNPTIMGSDVLTNSAAARVTRTLQSQQGIQLAPDRASSWRVFLRAHWEEIGATDFFTTEVPRARVVHQGSGNPTQVFEDPRSICTLSLYSSG